VINSKQQEALEVGLNSTWSLFAGLVVVTVQATRGTERAQASRKEPDEGLRRTVKDSPGQVQSGAWE
jgi:hypothetical protein